MTSYTENKPLVPGPLVPGPLVPGPLVPGPLVSVVIVPCVLVSDKNVLARGNPLVSDKNVLKKRYVESLDELDRIALNVAMSTLGSLFSLEKSNHYMEWKSAQRNQSADKTA